MATLAAVRLAVEQLKRDYPFVTIILFVKTDGAGAYSGMAATVERGCTGSEAQQTTARP